MRTFMRNMSSEDKLAVFGFLPAALVAGLIGWFILPMLPPVLALLILAAAGIGACLTAKWLTPTTDSLRAED